MIVLGGSLGGMKAMRTILQALPPSFSETLAVVLHRHRESDDLLIDLLQQGCPLPISEALDKEPFQPGHVYLAPPDYHLLLERTHFTLSTDDPVQFARPSIDVLFESAADIFGPSVLGVILTGANHDGAQGAARIQQKKGTVVVQDPATAASSVMPLAAIEATGTPHVCAPEQIGPLLLRLLGISPPASS